MANNNNVIDEYNKVRKYNEVYREFLEKGRKPLSDAKAKLCFAALEEKGSEKGSKIVVSNKAVKPCATELKDSLKISVVSSKGPEIRSK